MRIAVMGAGSIGRIVGAYLSKGNEDVLLVDTNKEHVKVMNKQGLKIDGVVDEILPVRAITPEELSGRFDLVFCCVKALKNREALNMLLPYLVPESVVVILQNGIQEDEIASIIGEDRTIGGITGWAATYMGPGYITKTSGGAFVIGELDGRITDLIKEIANILKKVEPVSDSDDIYAHIWLKLLVNASMSGMGTVLGCPFDEIIGYKEAMQAVRVIWKEGTEVGKALGVNPVSIRGMAPMSKGGPRSQLGVKGGKASMMQDIEKGIKCEIDYLNGYIVMKGKEVGIKTPVNEAVTRIIREIEEGRRKMGPQNLDDIKLSSNPTV
ncbi:MAG: 2-dehydropantoate 2-reductase [Halobacteriota archaeon]|nr:2-dehydropantoate 2-reductase [Halobacteriota archaeon]